MFNKEPLSNHIYQNFKHRTYTDPEMFNTMPCHCVSCENKCKNKLVRERESPNIYTEKWQVASFIPNDFAIIKTLCRLYRFNFKFPVFILECWHVNRRKAQYSISWLQCPTVLHSYSRESLNPPLALWFGSLCVGQIER